MKNEICPNGYRTLAVAVGVSYQAVQKWVKAGVVPARRVAAVSRVTGIPPRRLNPHFAALHDQRP